MIRHIVLFRWVEGTTTAQVDAVVDALTALPGVIAEVRSYEVGADLHLADGNADFAVVAEFDDRAGWETYRDHPQHRAVIAERITPLLAERTAIQVELT